MGGIINAIGSALPPIGRAIGNTLSGRNDILGDITNAGLLASLGIGAYGNYEIGQEAGQLANAGLNLVNKYSNQTPAQTTQQIQQYKVPLDQNLINDTLNAVQAALASSGMSVSPTIAYSLALTALAPYTQQNQQQASSEYFQQAQLPIEALGAVRLPNPANLTGIAEALGAGGIPGFSLPGGGGIPNAPVPPGTTTPTGTYPPAGTPTGTDVYDPEGPIGAGGGTGTASTVLYDANGNPIEAGQPMQDTPYLPPDQTSPMAGPSGVGDLAGGAGVGTIAGLGGLEGLPGFTAGSAELAGGAEGLTSGIEGLSAVPAGTSAISGVGGAAGDIASADAATGGAASSLLASVAPILGPATALLAPLAVPLALGLFGPDPGNVPAAQTEQKFEVAADDLLSAVKSGYVPAAKALQALYALQNQAGSAVFQAGTSGGTSGAAAVGGDTNVRKQLTSIINAIQKLGPVTQQPLNLAAASSGFVQPNTPGWYPGSITAGTTEADQLLQILDNG